MNDIKRLRYLVQLFVDDKIMSEMTSDSKEIAYGGAYSSLAVPSTRTQIFDGDQEVSMDEVEAYIAEISGSSDPRSDMIEDIRDVGLKTDNETRLIMADYLKDLARRMESEPLTVYEVMVYEHTHEGQCLGVIPTGYVYDRETVEIISKDVGDLLEDDFEAKLEEMGGLRLLGGDRWYQAVERCVEQGIIPPMEEVKDE
jgi:hypothetical protein